ncbi:MAG: glycosyltransferase family 4 protein [Nitrospirota bacterium]|jgi:glycosyltransferase involved in cell wall biosynthesis
MKIGVVGTRGFPGVQGGVERHCEELYPRLVDLGCEVTVFTRAPYTKARKSWRGVELIPLWSPRKESLEALSHTFLSLLRARRTRPDILHIHSIGPSLLSPLARLLDMKLVLTHHGPDYERAKWGKLAKTVLRQGERMGVLYSDRIIAISSGIREQVKMKFSREVDYIPNGVNVPNLIAPNGELRRWCIEPRGYVFTACRFVPEKGLHDLVEAYRTIGNPSFKLVIAGDADHETDYSGRLKRLAAETEGVVLTGSVAGERLGELFSNAGLFVLPSHYEGLPIALLEALSYGLPVLASDIPQHREIPLSRYRYFSTGNISTLSKAMTDSFSKGISDTERESYLTLIKEDYNWDHIAEKTLNIYKQALA